MTCTAINFNNKFSLFSDHFSPRIVAQMNDIQFKLVKFQGDFVWHSHIDTDEVFIVIKGEMAIDFLDNSVVLRSGEMLVVPKGIEHKPRAAEECNIMLVESAGTVNTGNSGGEMTAENDIWI